tara:strand:+ start:738 stop:1013 length:276 start_codon:yes stop_codon:yes gene_type:complete
MANVSMTLEEYEQLRAMAMNHSCENCSPGTNMNSTLAPKKRKKSAYNRKYAAAFKRIQGRYKKKSGGWIKDGFKRAQREAHRIARRSNSKR